jgi:ankyrin repeat/BTB/POZ domain-containing protein 2
LKSINLILGTILLLADIFSACYGRSSIEAIEPPKTGSEPQPRIDPKFVNNPELSDVSFRVENRIFYAHKLVLVTASPRFQSMLNSRFCEGSPPVLQINDIRYDIFQGNILLQRFIDLTNIIGFYN